MPPENMDPSDPDYLRPTADVYSLGCYLYQLSTGKRPWHAELLAGWGIVQFVKNVNISRRRPALDGIPAPLQDLIARCWKEPAERPSVAALVQELTALYTATSPPVPDTEAMRWLVEVCRRHAIRPDYASALRNLAAFDVVLICDDSGSMATVLGDGRTTTRWEELKGIVHVVTELAAAVCEGGCDVHFLNRAGAKGIKDPAQVTAMFAPAPSGSTPLTAALTHVLHDKGYRLAGEAAPAAGGEGEEAGPSKRLLFLIATDGSPNDGPEEFVATLQRLPENCFVQLVAVTDDDSVMQLMYTADEKIRFLGTSGVRMGR